MTTLTIFFGRPPLGFGSSASNPRSADIRTAIARRIRTGFVAVRVMR